MYQHWKKDSKENGEKMERKLQEYGKKVARKWLKTGEKKTGEKILRNFGKIRSKNILSILEKGTMENCDVGKKGVFENISVAAT